MNGLRIDRLVTSGTFSLDGGTWDVDNNVWIVGNDAECVVIDPAHDADAVEAAVAGRKVTAILLTHGHDDHIAAVGEFRERVNAPVYLNREDWMLWERVFPGTEPDHAIEDGDTFDVAGARLVALHTPGHSPGSMCFSLRQRGHRLQRRHPVPGRPGRHRPVLQRLPHHHRVHQEPAADAPGGHRGADRPRRSDDGRRRGAAAGGMDRPGPLG